MAKVAATGVDDSDERGTMNPLQEACTAWQGGMEGGSSPIRAAARNLTGTSHYFKADFITRYEEEARLDTTTTERARALLRGLTDSPLRTSAEWAEKLGVGSDWVGRGIRKGPQDAQILEALAQGQLTMPLWGASFDARVAAGYGDRFTFVIQGPFPAIPAWVHSGIVAEELELICGGRYEILEPLDLGLDNIVVNLSFIEAVPVLEPAGGQPDLGSRSVAGAGRDE